MVDTVKDTDQHDDLITSWSSFVHLGNIIYYKDDKAKPRVLKNIGAFYKNTEGRTDTFRSV